MSTIDLIILGVLLDKQMSAYDLTCLIEEKQVGRFLKISAPAVYKNCNRLCAAGFLDGEAVKKGGLPEKTVYRINKRGRERFLALMERFSSSFVPFFLDCNAFIWNIERVEKKQGLKMLRNLRDELSALYKWIPQHEKEESANLTFATRAIIKQYRMTVSALLIWSEEVIKDYNKLK